jgi:hypothetical protein
VLQSFRAAEAESPEGLKPPELGASSSRSQA